ncbi:MAG: hypothetical protein ACTSSG_14930 [Candidatus Heimdallarchaeaceae archaeon]
MKNVEKAKNWIEKLERTTQMFLSLPETVQLPNGWGRRELAIHFHGWDIEMMKIAEQLKQGRPFDWKTFFPADFNVDEANQGFLDRFANFSEEKAIETFKEKRKQFIQICRDLVTNHFQDNENFLSFFSLWKHDVHHLKQAGVETKEIEKEN